MRVRVFQGFSEGVLNMIEPDDVFDQLIKVSRSREQDQGGLNDRFDL